MRVKPAKPDHAAGLIDPVTLRSPFIELDADGKPRVLESAEVPENTFWTRRLLAGEVVRVDEQSAPDRQRARRAAHHARRQVSHVDQLQQHPVERACMSRSLRRVRQQRRRSRARRSSRTRRSSSARSSPPAARPPTRS
jgi:hypothetical protein